MKILKESKEQLPISFITDFVSRGWNTVGDLKENIAAIKEAFSGTNKIETIMQDLIDAYLICIGQMESYLDKQDYIDYPDEAVKEHEDKEDKENEVAADKKVVANKAKNPAKAPEIDLVEPETDIADKFTMTAEEVPEESEIATAQVQPISEPFAYFVDFDEPDMSEPKLTDDDIYGKRNIK